MGGEGRLEGEREREGGCEARRQGGGRRRRETERERTR